MKKLLYIFLFFLLIPKLAFGMRIISLKPNITEILFALNAGNEIVGATTWCDRPEAAKKIERVADYININTEKIISLKPDLIIGSKENSLQRPVEALQESGIRVETFQFNSLNELYSSIEGIGNLIGRKNEAKNLSKKIKKEVEGIEKKGKLNKKVLLLVGHRPLVAAGKITFYNDILKIIGAENIITGIKIPYPTINTEFIISNKPDLIIDLAMGSDLSRELPEEFRSKVIKVDISDFRAGPNIGSAIKKLRSLITATPTD